MFSDAAGVPRVSVVGAGEVGPCFTSPGLERLEPLLRIFFGAGQRPIENLVTIQLYKIIVIKGPDTPRPAAARGVMQGGASNEQLRNVRLSRSDGGSHVQESKQAFLCWLNLKLRVRRDAVQLHQLLPL